MDKNELNENIDRRNEDFNKEVDYWNKKNEEAKRRIQRAIEWKWYSLDSYVYLYESAPMDHYEEWKPLHTYSYRLHERFMKGVEESHEAPIHKQIIRMERLLLSGLLHYGNYLIDDVRGELIHYAFVSVENDARSYCENLDVFPVICLKGDNNGTMYAFSNSPYLAKNIPHDFGCDWELKDAQLTQFKKTSQENLQN